MNQPSSPPDVSTEPVARNSRILRVLLWALAAAAAGGAATFLFLPSFARSMLDTPSLYDLPVDASGYTVEELPFAFMASFAREHDVYFADGQGRVFLADDRDPVGTRRLLGQAPEAGAMLFVTDRGTILLAGSAMARSADGGKTWQKVIDRKFWRMDEDEQTHTLYAGNYEKDSPRLKPATLFASRDDGATWREVFTDSRLDHIHSVRCDPRYHRVYFSAGDGGYRGQAWSDDNGGTWQWINRGGKQGHTDLTITDDYVVWASDDHWGRILLAPRDPVGDGETILQGWGQQIWFVVAAGSRAYAGTWRLAEAKEPRAFLLASGDGGRSWRKLLSFGPPVVGLVSESRRLSAEGWLFFSTTDGNRSQPTDGKTYRVRKAGAKE